MDTKNGQIVRTLGEIKTVLVHVLNEQKKTNARLDETNARLDVTNQRIDETNRRINLHASVIKKFWFEQKETNRKFDERLRRLEKR